MRRPSQPRRPPGELAAVDVFVVPTLTFRLLFGFVILHHDRRELLHIGVSDIRQVVIAPRAPWQNSFAERVIGSIRRECLDLVIVLNERHLRRVLRGYLAYYNVTRPHQSLANNSPRRRQAQPPLCGRLLAVPEAGGFHHRYHRAA